MVDSVPNLRDWTNSQCCTLLSHKIKYLGLLIRDKKKKNDVRLCLVHGWGLLVGVVGRGVEEGGGGHGVGHQFMHGLLLIDL